MKFFPLPRSPQEKRDFFTGILTSPGADLCFRELASRGALQTLFPEIHAMIGVTQPPEFHPEGDVFEHTMLMLHHMAYPDPLLGWSVLLHDVGKPLTRSVELSGRIRFFNHEVKGAEMVREILGKMAFPEEEINAVVHAVKNHMRFAYVTEMRRSKVEAIINDPLFALELELHRLDCISCHGKMACFDFLLERLAERRLPVPPLIGGRALAALGIAPGKKMGEILKSVEKLRLEGKINTPEQAWEYVVNLKNKE